MDEKYLHEYYDLKARLAPFKREAGFEYVKTVSIIDAMLNRGAQINSGAVPFEQGLTKEYLINRAEEYLAALEKGEFPLKHKFTEPGIGLSDHCFIEKDGKMHLFYIRAAVGYDWREIPCDTLGHAVTSDLENWEILPPAVTGGTGTLDNLGAWSPGIAQKDGVYYMYYTGVNQNVAQSIFLATSKDLYNWEYYKNNPVYIPGNWCPWDENKWSNCRDSMVFADDDGSYYMYFCTSQKTKDGGSTNAVGIAVSRDMYNFKDVTRFCSENGGYMQESPFVIKHGGRYYLFYTACNRGTCYAVSQRPDGGFCDMGLLIGDEHHTGNQSHVPSCSEVFCFKDKWYISFATRQPGFEQYLELKNLQWNNDGTVTVL